VSRGAGIAAPAAVWQDMMAHGLIDAPLPACRADYFRFVTRGPGPASSDGWATSG
jgi:hypothetical protein